MKREKPRQKERDYQSRISIGLRWDTSPSSRASRKKKIVPAESSENSISFETVADSAERSGECETSSVDSIENAIEDSNGNLKDFLLTEADVEDAFSNLMGTTQTECNDEIAVVDISVEAQTVSETPEPITGKLKEKITEKVKGIEREDFILQNQNNNLNQNENLSQPSLFS